MNPIDNYVEQQRREAAELRALAGEVAELIGYTVDLPANDAYYRDAVRLHGPGGAALAVTRPWNNPLRISVHGAYPPGTTQVAYQLPSHTITVAVSRGAQAIARDIRRRLLPGYLTDLSRTLDALRARADATQAREKVAAELLAAVPGLRRGVESDTRVTLTYYGNSRGGPTGSVEISGPGDDVSITLTGPADVLLPAFTSALSDPDTAAGDSASPATHQPRPSTEPPETQPAT